MRTRLALAAGVVAIAAAGTIPALAAPTPPSSTVPPACIVAGGTVAVHVQVGYAPDGPGDCTVLP